MFRTTLQIGDCKHIFLQLLGPTNVIYSWLCIDCFARMPSIKSQQESIKFGRSRSGQYTRRFPKFGAMFGSPYKQDHRMFLLESVLGPLVYGHPPYQKNMAVTNQKGLPAYSKLGVGRGWNSATVYCKGVQNYLQGSKVKECRACRSSI